MNDVDEMYRLAAGRKVPLLRVSADAEEIMTGRIKERFPTGVTLVHPAATFADAHRVATAYRNVSGAQAGTGKGGCPCR